MTAVKTKPRTRLDPLVRRKQILDEAVRLIGLRGYHGFSIEELAQRCGLTNAGLLYYFESKEKLLTAVLEDRERRNAETIISVTLLRRQSERDKITLTEFTDTLHAIVARNMAQPEIVRLHAMMKAEALDPEHPAHAYITGRELWMIELFAKLIAPHVAHPYSTARQVSGMMSGLEQQWLRSAEGFDLVAEWDRAIALLLPKAERARSSGKSRAMARVRRVHKRSPHRE
jgi:AcrR family transcriptional regulator